MITKCLFYILKYREVRVIQNSSSQWERRMQEANLRDIDFSSRWHENGEIHFFMPCYLRYLWNIRPYGVTFNCYISWRDYIFSISTYLSLLQHTNQFLNGNFTTVSLSNKVLLSSSYSRKTNFATPHRFKVAAYSSALRNNLSQKVLGQRLECGFFSRF